MSIYYALLLPQHVRLKIQEIRRVLFSISGHTTFRALESSILLGKTDDTTLAKRVTCPTLPLKVQESATYSHHTLYFPVEQKELALLRTELGVSHPYSGIYLGEADMTYEGEIPPLKNLRLALVEIYKEGEITRWRTLAEKRLQKGKEA